MLWKESFLFYVVLFDFFRIFSPFSFIDAKVFISKSTFTCTQMPQNITVPYLAKEMVVDISGAAGGAGSTGIPGFGARVKSTIVVTAGSVLSIRIGCRGGGEGGAGGYNGGGNSYDGATGGGGASDIRLGGSQLSNRILVAGGGGGIYVYPYCGGIQKGGDGGQIGSAAAQNCANKAAQGGNATAGGTSVCYDNPCPTPGSLGKGGNGGFNHGGGGGGGYYGGGGGCFGGSGGGGSSYSIGSSTVYTSGYQKGDGNATITFYSQSYFYTQLSSFSPTYYEGFPIYGVNSSDTTGSVVNRLGDISGDGLVDVIVTAPAANNYKGVCFVIFGKTGGYHQKFFLSKMTLSQGIKIFGKTNDQLGIAASGLYDFNGDGYNDFAVAGYRPNYSAGVAYVFYGGPGVSNIDCSNLLPSQGFMITGFNGAQLAGAIRLNNDNLGDLILTRQYAGSAAGSAVGLTTVVYGKAGGYASIDLNAGGWTGFTISGAVSEEQSGSSVSAANDFNGDGADDFIIGAPIRSILNPSTGITVAEAGCVYLYLGNKTSNSNIDLSTGSNPRVLTYFLSQTPVSSRFGWSVASNSDLNKDGLNDIIIGAPTYNGVGAACIVYGSRNSSSITYLLNGFNGYCIFGVGGEFGYSLAGVGDLNGDGCGDIAIGARSLGEGRVYIVFGGPTSTTNFAINTLSSDKGYLVIGAAVGDQCGISIASSGDFDGDGYFDILVGARNANGTRGAAYILYGNNYQTAIPTSIPSSQPSSQPSRQPSIQPSGQPTTQPTRQPTSQPSEQPTSQPTAKPTIQPTSEPSTKPTSQPSMIPTNQPTNYPSSQPSSQPSPQPSSQPSNSPTVPPSTQPSSQPTKQPISTPTFYPSSRPSLFPSLFPSSQPTLQPTSRPSAQPSRIPSSQPTQFPTIVPTSQPTSQPSAVPTNQPTVYPSTQPTSRPSLQPSAQPSNSPSNLPSSQPTAIPSSCPSFLPSTFPTTQPTSFPSSIPSRQPSSLPSSSPSNKPSVSPTLISSSRPTTQPTTRPSVQPSRIPSAQPTQFPTTTPTDQPTSQPSFSSTSSPTTKPSTLPSTVPSTVPTKFSSSQPSSKPSGTPTLFPTIRPTLQPTSHPSNHPTAKPTITPTQYPSINPSSLPSNQPTSQPSRQPSAQPTCSPTYYPTTRSKPPFVTVRPSISVLPRFSPFKQINHLFGSTLSSDLLQDIQIRGSYEYGESYVVFGGNRHVSNSLKLSSAPSPSFVRLSSSGLMTGDSSKGSRSIAVGGDFNRDGLEDLLVGQPMNNKLTIVYSDRRNRQWRNMTSYITITSPKVGFGWSVSSAGDFNNDGHDDVVVSSLFESICYLFLGGGFIAPINITTISITTILAQSRAASITLGSDSSISLFGVAVSNAGDFNGDGLSDVMISALGKNGDNKIFIIYGRVPPLTSIVISQLPSHVYFIISAMKSPYSFIGLSLTSIGDMNGDGMSDIAFGSLPFVGGYTAQRTYVVYGQSNASGSLMLGDINGTSAGFAIEGGGFVVVGIGDVNHDGYDDLCVSNYLDWIGKFGSYIIRYPTDSITSYPTQLPTTAPSISLPSSTPSSSPSEKTAAPDLTKSPGATLKPSKQPVILPTHQPQTSSSPSARPTILLPLTVRPSPSPTTLTKTSRPSSRRPTAKPSTTSFPTSRPSSHPSFSGVRSIMITAGGKYYSSNGEERFTINTHESLQITNQEGKSRGSKVYIIVPATNLTTITRQIITIDSFDLSSDVIDLSQFTISEGSLVIATYPSLMIQLPTNQWIVLPSYSSFILTEKNIIFPTYTSSSTNNGDSFSMSSVLGWITSSDVLTVIIILITLFIGFFFILNYRKMQFYDFNITKRKKESDVVPEIDHYNSRAPEILSDDRQIVMLEERSSSSSIGKVIDEILEVIEKDEIDEESIDDSFCISSDSISDANNDSPIQDSIDSFRSFRSLSGDEASISLLSDDLQSSRQSPNE